jgi:mRNA interferase RelE/StbE
VRVDYTDEAKKQIKKLDKSIQQRILDYLDNVATLEDPRSKGKGLTSNLAGLWRYRVGDYRIICRIIDAELVILALEIGHRRDIYKK